ncbi:3-keto-5-aminohexanoate cleavage protein [Trujillonella humicola]|uniref:3-keto-5-aminohexanoate cleavage protein n=1 Tax=Trujillonella humicola TaxID=3383699 RepID=UPI00390674AB
MAPAAAAPDELAATARDCQAVGASVVVLPPLAPAAAREAVAALREETDLLVQAADPALGADLVVLPSGAPEPRLAELAAELARCGGTPVLEAGTLADLAVLPELAARTGAAGVHVSLVLGAAGGLPGTLPALAACLERLPAGVSWTAAGLGGAALPVLLAALSAGGHVRAGAADGPPEAGDPARADLQLVARAAGLARIAQRPPLSPDAARTLLLGPPAGSPAPRSAPDPTSVEIR